VEQIEYIYNDQEHSTYLRKYIYIYIIICFQFSPDLVLVAAGFDGVEGDTLVRHFINSIFICLCKIYFIYYQNQINKDRIDGVIVSILASRVVDFRFEPW
jgi:acetoin utilization deacetylase AcuC-like enzyme